MKAIVEKYLTTNNYKNERIDFEDFFLSHPNYPSLFAVTDTFNLLQIENVAAKIPKEQFTELPNTFLAVVADEIVLVTKDSSSVIIEREKEGKKKFSTDAFLRDWNGIIIAIDPKELNIAKKEITFFKNRYFLLTAVVIVIALLQIYSLDFLSLLNFSVIIFGFIISVLIIDEKLNKTDGVGSKICSFSEKTSCDSVIKSSNARITSWLDFSDLPIVFYPSSILMVLFNQNTLIVINLMSVVSLPIIGYSIWLQKVKLKKWCVLCLGVSFLFLLQTVFFFANYNQIQFDYMTIGTSILIVFSLWFYVKPLLFSKVVLQNSNRDLMKFKRNFPIFNSLSKAIKQEQKLDSLEKITLGNKEAKVTLSLILSPSCGHCHTAFKDGLELLKTNPEKINVEVFFNLNPENGDNPYFSVAENLMQINKVYPRLIEDALSDWHIKRMELDLWKSKWEVEQIDYDIEESIRSQYNWCTANEFNYTPVKLINNKLFPKEYEVSELKFFLSELEDELQPEMV